MRKILFILLFPIAALGQSETHNFTTYDTAVSLLACQFCAPDIWEVRVTRPTNMFTPGNPDTASRPAIIVMNGQGELGSVAAATAGVTTYGPHYWLQNGWDGSVVLGNGTHYPILITVGYTNTVYPTAPQYFAILSQLLATYHIKKGSVYLGGLSQGAFSAGALIEYEATKGAETGMSIIKAMALFEGTPDPLPAPYSTWSRDTVAYKVWAKKYGGRYFYLEGNAGDNFRDGWHYAVAMNDSVPGSAYFSYESLAGGGHGGWNGMYDPKATNWTSVGILGPNNSPSQAGQNSMGDYRAPASVFQWMLRQGDTSMVGLAPAIPNKPPIATINPQPDTIYLPITTTTLSPAASVDPDGKIVSYSWKQIGGTPASLLQNADNTATISGLGVGSYMFQLTVTDNAGASSFGYAAVIVQTKACPICGPIVVCPPPTICPLCPKQRSVVEEDVSVNGKVETITYTYDDGSIQVTTIQLP